MVKLLIGDCRDLLKTLPSGSVHCCVTSPPYFGLRDYGTAKWEGGDADCDHIEMAIGMSGKNTLDPTGHLPSSNAANIGRKIQYRNACAKCGACRVDCQIGLEQTPDEYVAEMVAVFREVRRVLRDDGTLWLNLGDSYAGSSIAGAPRVGIVPGEGGKLQGRNRNGLGAIDGIKPKDLIGIPWRVAFALQADGWWLRQDIIWHKPNPMPESVTDRCTKAHEYIFLLSKGPRYYYDSEAIAEPLQGEPHAPGNKKLDASRNDHDQMTKVWGANGMRNRRSVWTVSTKPYKGAHFATFPPDLIQPCILAGCPAGGTVLDPFGGSGTTGAVASANGRSAILIELNSKYTELVNDRCGLFLSKD